MNQVQEHGSFSSRSPPDGQTMFAPRIKDEFSSVKNVLEGSKDIISKELPDLFFKRHMRFDIIFVKKENGFST